MVIRDFCSETNEVFEACTRTSCRAGQELMVHYLAGCLGRRCVSGILDKYGADPAALLAWQR